MPGHVMTIAGSVVEVFGLVAVAWAYSRRFRPEMGGVVRLAMHLFIPCLAFTAIIEARLEVSELGQAASATLIQIGVGLAMGAAGLRLAGRRDRRELLLPIAFVNSANLPFPLLLANFGAEGLSRGVLCYTVTNLTIFSVGVLIVHGRGGVGSALKEPALWATILAGALRLGRVEVPEVVLRIPKLAAGAAVPVMLVIFGDALARTRWRVLKDATLATTLRYASGAVALGITLALVQPQGLMRKVLILYALLPSAVVNIALAEKGGRNAEAVASTVLLTTLGAVVLIPILLALSP